MSILRIINGPNTNRDFIPNGHRYITDSTKTGNGKYVGTINCSNADPVKEFLASKKLWNKTHGKQGIQIVISFTSSNGEVSEEACMQATREIISRAFPNHMAFFGLHLDNANKHSHSIINSLDSRTGKKLSISPKNLNQIKMYANNALERIGCDLITTSANDFNDINDYTNLTDYSYFELNADIFNQNIAALTTNSTGYSYCTGGNKMNFKWLERYVNKPRDDFGNPISGNPYYSGRNTSTISESRNIVPANTSQAIMPVESNTSDIDVMPYGGFNKLPNVTITNSQVEINATTDTDLSCLGDIVSKAALTEQEMQQKAKLALALSREAQKNGYPIDVNVTGTIIKVDSTGGVRNYIDADYTEK